MDAVIYLKSGLQETVKGLTLIKVQALNRGIEEIKDFTSFFPPSGKCVFVGESTVSVDGSDLLLVKFY
jgi:hypothetical protein|nr:MAG TPA: hypothetical protein [Caudoviricetes sp.]